MSYLEGLIKELCPNGVPFLSIQDPRISLLVASGATPKSHVKEFWEGGTIRWMSSGEVNKRTIFDTDDCITEAGFESCSTKMIPAGAVVIALAGQGKTRGTVARTRVDLCTNQSLASIVTSREMNSDFLYYYLRGKYQHLREISSGEGTRGGLNLRMIREYKVPLPPLLVQREIVRILDMFTQLEAELEAELEARRKQYNYYRTALLNNDNIESRSLSDLLFSLSSGKNKSRVDRGQYPVFGSTGRIGSTDRAVYTDDAILIARVGANAGRVNAVSGAYDVSDNTLILRPTPELNIRFAFHLLTNMDLNQYALGAGQPLITGKRLKNLDVSVPSMSEQVRIAEILDKFEALVNDLSSGLPAEIAERRKQYEYYRDKLLSFKELSS